MKKILAIVMAVAMVMALSVTAFAAEDPISVSVDNLSYYGANDCTNYTVTNDGINTSELAISFYLNDTVEVGETVELHITGSSDGDFRLWLANEASTASNIVLSTDLGLTGGAFDTYVTLTATSGDNGDVTSANTILFKGIDFSTNLNNFTITSIAVVTDSDAAETATEETSDEASEEVADTSSTETASTETTTTNADTGVVLAVLPMAVAAAAVVVSKRR